MRHAAPPRARPEGLLLALVLVWPGAVEGQVAPELPDQRASRTLALGELSFMGEVRPWVLVGGLHQVSFRPIRTVPDEDGIQVRRLPSAYLHLAAAGGWSFERDPAGGAVARVGIGLVQRIQPTPVSALGPVAGVTFGERSYGLGLRAELLDNIGVQVGWVHRDRGSRDRVQVSVDALHCILQDLGFIQHCPGSRR